MLHPVNRLATSEGQPPKIEALGVKAWRRVLLLPRQLCVFESLPCEGLAWHEYRNFASLQARRLAPYMHCGVNAVVRSGRLMLWFWDQQELDTLLGQCGTSAANSRLMVETLFMPLPRSSGDIELQSPEGRDRIKVEAGAIVSSQWEERQQRTPGIALPWRNRPWAFELIGNRPQVRRSSLPGLGAAALRHAPLAVGGAAALYLLFHAGVYLGSSSRLAVLEREADVADQRISSLSAVGQELRQETQWLSSYRQAAASVDLQHLIDALAPVLERHGVVLKEFDLRNEQLRIAVITAGGDIDLPALLDALSRLSGVSDVQLRDNTELRQASFSLQVSGLRRLLGPGA